MIPKVIRSTAALQEWVLPGVQRRPLPLVILVVAFVPATFLDSLIILPVRMLDNPASILGVLLIGFFAVTRLGKVRLFSGPSALALTFLVAATLALVLSGNLSLGSDGAKEITQFFQYVQVVALFFIFRDVCHDARALQGVALAMVASCTVMSLLAHAGYASLAAQMDGAGRMGVGGMNLNGQAYRYSFCIIGVFCWCLTRWPRLGAREWILAACVASMTLATVRTASRGGLVMLAVGLATALVLFLRKRRASAYLFLAPAALAGIAYTVLTSELVQARFEAALAGRTGSRLELAEGGWSLFLQKPWFGWGTAYVFELGAITGKERIAAHNTYLQILVSFGLLGFLPWFALLLTTGYNLWCHRRHLLGAMALALFVGSLVFSIVSNNGYNKTFWMSLGVATVVPAVLRVSPTKKVPSRWQKRGASIGSGRPSVPRFVEPQTTPRFWPRAG